MIKPIKPRLRSGRTKWDINYRVPGYNKVFYESFDTEEAALVRAAELTLNKQNGTLRPPDETSKMGSISLNEYLRVYVRDYGNQHWGDSYHADVLRLTRDYVQPSMLGRLLLRDIRAADLDRYYAQLLHTPAVIPRGHKDHGKLVSYSIITRIHGILRAAFAQAVKWGYIPSSPAIGATVPRYERKERRVWSPEIASAAISMCEDTNLRCCILLAIGCSMRVGEILGLQWDNLDLTGPEPILHITQQLHRCQRSSIEETCSVERRLVSFIFPSRKVTAPCETVLVLKRPKSVKGIRDNFIPQFVADELLKLKAEQDAFKQEHPDSYTDFGLVFAWPNGHPIEPRKLDYMFDLLIKKNNLPRVAFHSLRHLSASIKLQYSGGDIKAVQADMGHAQSKMVTEVYSHTFSKDRRRIAKLMNDNFFRQGREDSAEADDVDHIVQLLRQNPEMADPIRTLLEKMQ